MVNKYEKTFNLMRNRGNTFSDHDKRSLRQVKFKSLTLANVVQDMEQQELYRNTEGCVNRFNFFEN